MDQKNLAICGDEPIPWSRAREQLKAGSPKSCWLAMVHPDGRPHITGIRAIWSDGKFCFTSGPATLMSRNLAANPKCAASVTLPNLDLVVKARRPGSPAKTRSNAWRSAMWPRAGQRA